jgi:hypothetical protein
MLFDLATIISIDSLLMVGRHYSIQLALVETLFDLATILPLTSR